MAKEVVICEKENIAAVVENGKVVEFFMNEGEQLVGDIILGIVDSIVPSIEAAFVKIGNNKNGFIHIDDLVSVNGKKKTDIKFHLKPKQKLLVQVSKEATSSKGPRLTCSITLPGKYLVLTPYERKIAISKKITDPIEKERLVSIAKNICKSGYGIIIRTEAIDQSEKSLQEDLDYLLNRWNEILNLSETSNAPSVLYRDQDLLYRVLRDSVDNDTDKIIVDTLEGKNRAYNLLNSWSSLAATKIYLSNSSSVATEYNLYYELENALTRKVPLPSGGYLIIEHTEALTVIDVNSGTSKGYNNLSQTILQTNKEAAVEIARQIRLRDIGGVIVVDFIDMTDPREQQIIWQLFSNSTKNDKSRPQLGYFSEFSLLELTRHRQRKSLYEMLTNKCPYCNGEGRIRNKVYRFDVLSYSSINRRLHLPENKKFDERKSCEISTSEIVEDRMNKIPLKIQKQKDLAQRNQFTYFKNETIEDKKETNVESLTQDEPVIEVVTEDEQPVIELVAEDKPLDIDKKAEKIEIEKEEKNSYKKEDDNKELLENESIRENINIEPIQVINLLDTEVNIDTTSKPKKKKRRIIKTFLPKKKKKDTLKT